VSGGENISTVEVEPAVVSHPGVLEVAVIAVPHDKWGERPKAFVVPKPGTVLIPEDITRHLRGRIAKFKIPDSVEFVEQLPKDLHWQDPEVPAPRAGGTRPRLTGSLVFRTFR
jgi:fatty-acyl-CoA synthase